MLINSVRYDNVHYILYHWASGGWCYCQDYHQIKYGYSWSASSCLSNSITIRLNMSTSTQEMFKFNGQIAMK